MSNKEFNQIKSYAVIGYAMKEKGYTEKDFYNITDEKLKALIDEFDNFIARMEV